MPKQLLSPTGAHGIDKSFEPSQEMNSKYVRKEKYGSNNVSMSFMD